MRTLHVGNMGLAFGSAHLCTGLLTRRRPCTPTAVGTYQWCTDSSQTPCERHRERRWHCAYITTGLIHRLLHHPRYAYATDMASGKQLTFYTAAVSQTPSRDAALTDDTVQYSPYSHRVSLSRCTPFTSFKNFGYRYSSHSTRQTRRTRRTTSTIVALSQSGTIRSTPSARSAPPLLPACRLGSLRRWLIMPFDYDLRFGV